MFTHPDQEWSHIKKEHKNPLLVYSAYVGILGLISPICAYISTTQFGWQVGSGQLIKLTPESALPLVVLTYVAMLVGVFGLGWAIDWMGKNYGRG
ncbi:MAG: Yip1 family protein, partial [Bermanella sp.]